MCGLVGVFYSETSSRPTADLSTAARLMQHRGPDGDGLYESSDGRCRLAFRRLSIIDLDTGDQPLHDVANGCALVGNGEIYNFLELRQRFSAYPYKTTGDMETVLASRQALGCDYVHALNGMFALAIYDEQKKCLELVRDRLGIKPLYWAELTGGGLVFASEIKALFATGLVRPALNQRAVTRYLDHGFVPGPETLFAGVMKLMPGHRLTMASDGEPTIVPYWQAGPQTTRFTSEQEATEKISAVMEDSVRLQLRSDVPVGCLLSGGIDSGLVTAFAAKHTSGRLRTFTARFHGGTVDETPLAEAVAEKFDTDHTTLDIAADDISTELPRLIWHMEEPINDPALLPNFMVERALSAHVRVALNGTGGDEIFAGYGRYFPLDIEIKYQRLPAALRRAIIEPIISKISPMRAWQLGRSNVFATNRGAYQFAHATHFPAPIRAMIGNLLPVGQSAQSEAFSAAQSRHTNLDPQTAGLIADIQTYLAENLLPLLDRTSMMVSVEGRVPLLDHRLVETALAVEPEVRTPGGRQKGLQRRIAEEHLPPFVVNAPKHGFVSPVPSWVRGQFGRQARRILTRQDTLARGWWSQTGIDYLFADPDRHGYRIYSLLVLELTVRMFIDNPLSDQPPSDDLDAWADD